MALAHRPLSVPFQPAPLTPMIVRTEEYGRPGLAASSLDRKEKCLPSGNVMSLVDTFDERWKPAYPPIIEPQTSYQELRLSFVLVMAMAVAAFILGFALPLDAPYAPPGKPVASDSGNFHGRVVTINGR